MIRLTLEELNIAYRECKLLAEKRQVDKIEVFLGRDPLTLHNLSKLYPIEDQYPLVLRIQFEFDYSIGIEGRWICTSEVDVIDIDE